MNFQIDESFWSELYGIFNDQARIEELYLKLSMHMHFFEFTFDNDYPLSNFEQSLFYLMGSFYNKSNSLQYRYVADSLYVIQKSTLVCLEIIPIIEKFHNDNNIKFSKYNVAHELKHNDNIRIHYLIKKLGNNYKSYYVIEVIVNNYNKFAMKFHTSLLEMYEIYPNLEQIYKLCA